MKLYIWEEEEEEQEDTDNNDDDDDKDDKMSLISSKEKRNGEMVLSLRTGRLQMRHLWYWLQ